MLERFSTGYYRTTMSVQPVERGSPVIERGLYDLLDRNLYAQTDAPVQMRLSLDEAPTFVPEPENGVPTDAIGVPETVLDDSGVHPSSEQENVFILSPEHAFVQTQETVGEY